MDAESIAHAAYIVAALLFILSLAGLSRHETARQGIIYGIAGMAIALAAVIGVAIGILMGRSRRIEDICLPLV
ncbi:MAG: NAD(P)(+) transhydrogenase (Re/Si-specific) subunit beta, partial [Actinomycetes bacterium]